MFIEDKASGETPSLDGFIDFLGKQPGDRGYNWPDSCNCACAQYLKSVGKFDEKWLHGSSDSVMHRLNRIAGGERDDYVLGYSSSGWTFGACLERAKKAKELV